MDIRSLVKECYTTALAHGWWEGYVDRKKTIPEKLALIHSEVSEALEDYRNGDMAEAYHGHTGKPLGFPSELADIVIRVADLAGALGIDLEKAVVEKMAYNEKRPYRHGGKRA